MVDNFHELLVDSVRFSSTLMVKTVAFLESAAEVFFVKFEEVLRSRDTAQPKFGGKTRIMATPSKGKG